MSNTPLLELEQVSLQAPLGSSYLLQDISFTVSRGDRLVLISPSGGGKTTLLRLLNRLIDPTRGNIRFQGDRLERLEILQLRRQVVYLPQEPRLLGMNVGEAIAYPLRLQGLPEAEIHSRLQYWCQQLHIPQQWHECGEVQLSVGQRQRVAIARALVMEPRLLLLDEPTASLDFGSASQILHVLSAWSERDRRAYIMANHDLELAKQYSDRVAYLESGQLLHIVPTSAVNWQQMRQTLVAVEEKEMEWEK